MKVLFWSAFVLWTAPLSSTAQQLTDLKHKDGMPVGHITFDPALDNPDFTLCGGTIQENYAVSGGYQGGRKRLLQLLEIKPLAKQRAIPIKTGYITVRFVVNCRGEVDRFRVLQIDRIYKPTIFDPAFVAAILTFTKALDDWIPGQYQGSSYDYFQQLTFKINDGQVVDILP
ncbi:hypothetical protein [Parapedobacter koreensis]|uniref:TonB protein C-terminal n=1 Tax=Parapedobacter koreensis TaxID=332977 RepID=A0A1H7R303_9SPHI|nr:hypothetical protein [Parapedobacter koreensis]SEL54284.1 hypothetical protein SAMN05421740_106231 [Parapedobacter koreensis]